MANGSGRTRLRGIVRAIGTTLVVMGIAVVLWGLVIWRFGDPVTGLYTRWQQHQLAGRYAEVEAAVRAAVAPVHVSASRPGPRAIRTAERRAAHAAHRLVRTGEPLGRIKVPRLDLNMLLVTGTDHSSLRKGPGWDERTYLPGEGQLVYIAGHRTTFGAPFGNIDRLRPGDPIEIDLPYGTFSYRVTRSVIVPANDLARLETQGREVVALQACHPRFSARERYIVYAKPVAFRPAAGLLER